MTEDQVLVELDAALPVQVDVEQLAGVQGLSDAVGEVEPGHLLVADLGVDAEQVGLVEGVDEGDGVPDGRQQDVAARLVRLRLDGEPQVVALVGDVLGQQVDALAVAGQRGLHVLGRVELAALPTAPHDEGLGAQLGGQVEIAEQLAQREPAHGAVVGGDPAVLEHRVAEQVRGDHRHGHAGVREDLLQPVDLGGPLGVGGLEREQVVVVEGEAVRPDLGELRSTASTTSSGARLALPNWS